MNKTDRKNKTNLNVTWPEHGKLFTIKDLMAANPEFVEITLRVRVDKAIKKDNTVAIIGYKNTGKGRPTMMLTMAPVTQQMLDDAYATGIQPPETKPIVSIIDVSTTESNPTTTDVAIDIPETVPTVEIPV
jgi:hypothetical protein